MKRKKWSELEEQTLLGKYSELSNSGALSKLKTREKKFKPIADHVNAVHHLRDPSSFPFKWSWRDVSIKVQNMRHQYLGVKQKIRVSNDEFNWKDGENHWENFLKYKEVFGDVELEVRGKRLGGDFLGNHGFADLGLRFGIDSDDEDDEEEEEEEEEDGDGNGHDDEGAGCADNDRDEGGVKSGTEGDFREELQNQETEIVRSKKSKKGFGFSLNKKLGLLGAQALELRDVMVRKEEKRREREFGREKSSMDREEKRKEMEFRREMRQSEREERVENRELELEERELMWARREFHKRLRLEQEFDEERRRRRRMEERREEEEMEWRERMLGMQIEHEKAMMQMHAEAYQNQMQTIGVMARLVCQFFGSTHDALTGGLGGLPPQVLQNLQHPGDLGDNGKPDANSPSEFMSCYLDLTKKQPLESWHATFPSKWKKRLISTQKDSPSTLSLSPRMSIFPRFTFHLRHSQFLQTPALLDVAAIAADRILLMDAFFTAVIFHGATIAQWQKAGYQNQPEHQAFAELLQGPREDADLIIKERFVFDQHGFQARFLLAKLNPSRMMLVSGSSWTISRD